MPTRSGEPTLTERARQWLDANCPESKRDGYHDPAVVGSLLELMHEMYEEGRVSSHYWQGWHEGAVEAIKIASDYHRRR